MAYYPIMVDLTGREVLVIGGGSVAGRKIETLLEYGAVVSVVSRELSSEIKAHVEGGRVRYLGEEFSLVYLKDKFLVIAATDDAALNHRISQVAEEKGMLINAVDQPADCNFIVPSIIKRGDLVIAVSTSGKSPAFAKKIRKQLTDYFGDEYDLFLRMMGKIRNQVLAAGSEQMENSRLFHRIVDSELFEAVKAGELEKAARILAEILKRDISAKDIKEYLKK
ncbi:MAG: bifunctional precorrin-2 dehydrogenase/sirohydrochlorin ferrochelatase [Deltaproteobacteria bacterium]|nr:bifunctional precorrin-2 dehydrogenase/sirohydrochlorin ferrochelatase [Deltaproteobacteria bacterium]